MRKKQRRYRERQNALRRSHPEVEEAALLQEAERAHELSDEERVALANRLADAANQHLWRAHELSRIAQKVRYGRP
jgi:hypothetical protein